MWLKVVFYAVLVLSISADDDDSESDEREAGTGITVNLPAVVPQKKRMPETDEESPEVIVPGFESANETWSNYSVFWIYDLEERLVRAMERKFKLTDVRQDADDDNNKVMKVNVSPQQKAAFVELLRCREVFYRYIYTINGLG